VTLPGNIKYEKPLVFAVTDAVHPVYGKAFSAERRTTDMFFFGAPRWNMQPAFPQLASTPHSTASSPRREGESQGTARRQLALEPPTSGHPSISPSPSAAAKASVTGDNEMEHATTTEELQPASASSSSKKRKAKEKSVEESQVQEKDDSEDEEEEEESTKPLPKKKQKHEIATSQQSSGSTLQNRQRKSSSTKKSHVVGDRQ
jgi:hypothetical protein